MYDGPGMSDPTDEDNDDDLEHSEDEIRDHFEKFWYDIVPEFKKFGEIEQLRVCRNHSHHLRGNVYVMYRTQEDAVRAYSGMNGRFYAGRKLIIQFSPVVNWKSAVCGLFTRQRCERGKQCNFLHVFQNPKGLLEGRDSRDSRDKNEDSDGEEDRKRSRREKDRDRHSSSSSRHRYKERERDRDRDRESDRHKSSSSRDKERDKRSSSRRDKSKHRSRRERKSDSPKEEQEERSGSSSRSNSPVNAHSRSRSHSGEPQAEERRKRKRDSSNGNTSDHTIDKKRKK